MLSLMTNNGFESDNTGLNPSADSVTLTQYSSEASQLIKSYTKNRTAGHKKTKKLHILIKK